jgi:hypothetical protein
MQGWKKQDLESDGFICRPDREKKCLYFKLLGRISLFELFCMRGERHSELGTAREGNYSALVTTDNWILCGMGM